MKNLVKRPISVWIAQILLLIFAVILLLPPVLLLFSLPNSSVSNPTLPGLMFMVVIYAGMIGLILAAFWGMVKRKSWGRWLCVGLLLLFFFFSVVGQIVRPSGPIKTYQYNNDIERMSGIMTQIVMSALWLLLIYFLAFGAKAKAFFSPDKTPDSIADPPPPPVFNDEPSA